MQAIFDISDKGKDFIKRNEGLSLDRYRDVKGLDTIGYGHLITSSDTTIGASISKKDADILFDKDVAKCVKAFNRIIDTAIVTLTQEQYDACIDLIFNVGITAFSKSKFARKLVEMYWAKEPELVTCELLDWDKITVNGVKRVCNGLTARRSKEHILFCQGCYAL